MGKRSRPKIQRSNRAIQNQVRYIPKKNLPRNPSVAYQSLQGGTHICGYEFVDMGLVTEMIDKVSFRGNSKPLWLHFKAHSPSGIKAFLGDECGQKWAFFAVFFGAIFGVVVPRYNDASYPLSHHRRVHQPKINKVCGLATYWINLGGNVILFSADWLCRNNERFSSCKSTIFISYLLEASVLRNHTMDNKYQ